MTFLYWLLCFLIGIIPAFLVFQKDRKRNIPVRWLPATLRFALFFLVAALLLGPAFPGYKTTEEKPVIIWLQDNSLSIKNALGKDSVTYRKKAEALWKKWGKDYQVVPFSFGGRVEKGPLFGYTDKRTDMGMALEYISGRYLGRNIGAVILSGDGVFNAGANPLYTTLPNTAPVYTIGLGDSTQPRDARISRVYANKTVPVNSKFELIADMEASGLNGQKTQITILHNGRDVGRAPVTINKDRFSASFHFEINATEKGFQRYTVSIPAVGDEKNTRNNSMDLFVEVLEQDIRVLLLAAAPHPDVEAIKKALEATPQYKLTIRYSHDFPESMDGYSLVIAHQVPAAGVRLPEAATKMPVWYILGAQSDLAAFGEAQSLLRISRGGSIHDALPLLNTGFRLFTLPADIGAVVSKMPPLNAPSGPYQVTGDAQMLFQQQGGNASSGLPLWLMQTGEMPCAVLCGTGIWRWRLYEYKSFRKHGTIDELIRQTVRLLSVKKDTRPFRVFMDKYVLSDNEPALLRAELRNQNRELVNEPEVRLIIRDSSGKTLHYTFEKDGLRYVSHPGILGAGNYTFEGTTTYNGKPYVSKGAFTVSSVPLELLRGNADFDLLYKLARQHNGLFFTGKNMDSLGAVLQNDKRIKPVLHSEITYIKWIDRKWLFFLILVLAATEWLLRKYWNL